MANLHIEGSTKIDNSNITLNDLITYLDKNYILVNMKTNKTINCTTSWSTYLIPWDNVRQIYGDRFTLNSNGSVSYTGTRPIKCTIHLSENSSDTCGSIYPASNFNTYYQQYIDRNQFHRATHISLSGGGSLRIEGYIRPSGVGIKYLNAANNGNSAYDFMLVEEL